MKRAAILLPACLALSACTVALHGHESSGGGARNTATSGSVHAGASGRNFAASVSSGSPSPGARGGQVVLTRDASVALVLGLVLIDALSYLSEPSGIPRATSSAQRPIAHTCSCYGYRPDSELTQAATAE